MAAADMYEEEEETLCSYRSKLFLYGETLLDKGTGVKSWKERGIGDAAGQHDVGAALQRPHQRLRAEVGVGEAQPLAHRVD